MSDRGQQSPSSADPVPGAGTPAEDPVETGPADDDVPFEITPGDGDAAFRLVDAESDESAGANEFTSADETTGSGESSSNRKVRTVVLGSLLVIALAGLGTVGWFGWKVNSQRHTTLSTPASIGALTLDDSEQAAATADYLQTALSAEIPMDKAVGAVYTGSDEKTVLFFGGTTLLWSPQSDLDSAFTLVSDDQSAVTGLREVDAGDFGGTMKCGVANSPDGDLTVCGWADHGSLALAMFADRTEAEAAPLMRELRSAIQTRS